MKLGLGIGYAGAEMRLPVERVQLAERLGFDSVWTAETYGTDAMSPLAYLAAVTSRIRLGTGIAQLAARPPATAMLTAATIDAMSGGRFICAIGLSGPQIVEGWYGQPWGRPNKRLRDYITIMKKIRERAGPVTHEGPEIALPYEGAGASGLAKPLKSILHIRPDQPIWMGTGNHLNVRLAGELADGWIGSIVPRDWPLIRGWLEEGFERAGGGKSLDSFEVFGQVAVVVDDDVKAALDQMRPERALYIGGMGARTKNFHAMRMARRGYAAEAERIQELFLAGRKKEAEAAIPEEFLDEEMLAGPPERIRERFRAWEDLDGVDGLVIRNRDERSIEVMAEITGATAQATA